MITIDQLLESVDLDFEPRWVTKNKNGGIYVWATRPHYRSGIWFGDESVYSYITKLKLAEFEGKSSDDCIYEVPRKENKIERLETDADYMQLSSASMSRNRDVADTIIEKINELVDAVNELKGANQ